ncbi:MAG: penicillin-binding protein 1C [Prolixibacteraceae bacterium]|nr:penicillin-binding protein 1C [Burkholderiales bacterium]
MGAGKSVGRSTVILCALFVAQWASAAIPTFVEVKSRWTSTEGVLLDRHGAPIHELRVIEHGRRLAWARLDEISPVALATIIRAEDKRFYQHHGVDWLALSDAALDTLLLSQPRGASTISMQVASHLDAALKPSRQKRTVSQKWDQIAASQALEKFWSKRQILEAYLNLSTFRGEVQGVGAASRALFGKDPSGLDEPESLLLAVLLRGPNARPEGVSSRACRLAAKMQVAVACEQLQMLVRSSLPGAPNIIPRVALAPHVARELVSAKHPRVQTTLDAELQTYATELLQQQLAALADRHVADAAALVVDNRSGEVLAYVGNAGSATSAVYVDGVRAPRQAGSTLKPFLYEMAIGQKLITAASLIDDSPVNLVTPSGLYVPQNYDRDFKGLVSARTALSSSLNVPAVRTLMLVGADAFVERLQRLGFDDVIHDGDFYGFSLALGSAEVSLWQLTNAYRAIANGGRWSPLKLQRALNTASALVLDPGASWIVASMLSDPVARSVTFGLENSLTSRHWTAVKTGTSKDMRDNWCVGFSDRYTVGVWVGNFDGSPMHDVSGVTGAAPVWMELVDYLHRRSTSMQAPRPAPVIARRIEYEKDIEAAREEYFVAGTEIELVAAKAAASIRAGIAYPGNGSIIALDPDIPDKVQRVRFVAAPQFPGQRWQLDGETLGTPDQPVLWAPQPGRHDLVLMNAKGEELDRVRFEVRGAARIQ